jgi:hypothetical protein
MEEGYRPEQHDAEIVAFEHHPVWQLPSLTYVARNYGVAKLSQPGVEIPGPER